MNKKLLLLFLIAINHLIGQEKSEIKISPPISTDRPDNSDSPYTIEKENFQFETGISYSSGNSNGLSVKTLTLNTGLFRFGVFDDFELRLGYDLINEKNNLKYSIPNDFKSFNTSYTSKGLNPLLLGFKFLIQNGNEKKPAIGFVSNLYLPFSASKDLKPKSTAADFKFALSHSLSETQNLSYNFGVQWGKNEYILDYLYSIVYGTSIKDKLGLFFELYGDISEKGYSNNYWDSGITYLVNNNFQLDASIGSGIASDQVIYLSFGFSQRFIPKKP